MRKSSALALSVSLFRGLYSHGVEDRRTMQFLRNSRSPMCRRRRSSNSCRMKVRFLYSSTSCGYISLYIYIYTILWTLLGLLRIYGLKASERAWGYEISFLRCKVAFFRRLCIYISILQPGVSDGAVRTFVIFFMDICVFILRKMGG